jgi:hypothetical protein
VRDVFKEISAINIMSERILSTNGTILQYDTHDRVIALRNTDLPIENGHIIEVTKGIDEQQKIISIVTC